jgi:hypothetical protein
VTISKRLVQILDTLDYFLPFLVVVHFFEFYQKFAQRQIEIRVSGVGVEILDDVFHMLGCNFCICGQHGVEIICQCSDTAARQNY